MLSIATLRPPAVVYREEQHFAWWIYALLVVVVGLMILAPALPDRAAGIAAAANGWGLGVPIVPIVALSIALVLVVCVLRMTTEVTPTDVRVWFGFIPTYRHFVGLSTIERLEVVSYRPIADYGFWGVRWGRDGERVLSARGNRGVRLYLTDGTRLLIGSQRPEALAIALETAIHPHV